ncbi:hypothetical protein [Streptomyces canus]|uniref:hypothetical protein n=1 Tax=Streptomyces canus TaxID=58343 RepID=UPI0030E41675
MWRRQRDEQGGNSGIQNSGYMHGVQNQPGAAGSTQSQGLSAPDPQTLRQITEGLALLRGQLDTDREQIQDHDQCITFLDLAAGQPLDQPEGRTTAAALLTRIRDLCAGATEVVGLATTVMALIASLQA